jgi:hypothetical protein
VAAVPAYYGCLRLAQLEESTDRLAAEHPEMEVWAPGVSRAGRPIRCVESRGGPHRALLVALLCRLVAVRDRCRPARRRPPSPRNPG